VLDIRPFGMAGHWCLDLMSSTERALFTAAAGGRQYSWLELQPPLRALVLLAGGAAEGVGAAGGQLHRAFAQAHRLFDGNDLQARDGGKARLDMLAGGGGLGDHGGFGGCQGKKHTHLGTFTLDHAFQVKYHIAGVG